MTEPKTTSGAWAASNAKNTKRLGYWTGAWVITMALANFGPKFIWQENETLTLLAIILNVVIGFGMIIANIRQLKGLDELQQKIQLEAMGMALGVGLVLGLAYSNLDVTNLIPFDAEISQLFILMGLTYGFTMYLGMRKYR